MRIAEQEKSALTKEEKAIMKEKIRRCFNAFEICQEKHHAIRKFNRILEESRLLLGGNCRDSSGEMMEEISNRYMIEIRKVTEGIHEILDERRRLDHAMRCLSAEEEQFLLLRYEKQYDYTRICYEMHMSRARSFRLQDKALLHLKIALEKNEKSYRQKKKVEICK